MKITTEKYAIITKGFPLTFIDDCGCECDSIEDDVLFDFKLVAKGSTLNAGLCNGTP